MKPFKQGHLDGLCGVYAIINGMRVVLERRFPERKCQLLFDLLTQHAIKEQGMLDLVSGGVGQRQMQQLLSVSLEYLEEFFPGRGMPTVSISQPWRNKTSQIDVDYSADIQRHVSQKHSAVIIGIEHPMMHWSVLSANNAKVIHFFDSDKLDGAIKDQLKISTEHCTPDNQYIVLPQSVFFLKASRKGLT